MVTGAALGDKWETACSHVAGGDTGVPCVPLQSWLCCREKMVLERDAHLFTRYASTLKINFVFLIVSNSVLLFWGCAPFLTYVRFYTSWPVVAREPTFPKVTGRVEPTGGTSRPPQPVLPRVRPSADRVPPFGKLGTTAVAGRPGW